MSYGSNDQLPRSVPGFFAGETSGLDPIKASLTLLETCACCPWDPLTRPEAADAEASPQAGCAVALRCHILQKVIATWCSDGVFFFISQFSFMKNYSD